MRLANDFPFSKKFCLIQNHLRVLVDCEIVLFSPKIENQNIDIL